MTVAVEITEAMKTLPDLVKRVKNGDEIVLSDSATPVARIMPVERTESTLESGPNLALFKDLIGSISRRPDGAVNHDRYLCEIMKS